MDTHQWQPGDPLPHLTEAHLLGETSLARSYAINDAYVAHELVLPADQYLGLGLLDHITEHGYTAPRLIEIVDNTLIMEHIHGPTLFQALVSGETSYADGAEIVDALHRALHDIPLPKNADQFVGKEHHHLLRGTDHERASNLAIIHLDLHPANIILAADGAYPINWECARIGPPDLDRASTALAIGVVASEVNELQQASREYLHQLHRLFGNGYLRYLDEANAHHKTHPDLTDEDRGHLDTAQLVVRDVASQQ
ncbi:phosphotransferase [Jonesia quinghaiensis]|uniref:phosphotransferase n=1 Tax=Jonesia quinghaiensis TaxID=262806 RepID=UPI00068406D7|nr:phosphotransferase [Jonesia quinghaiensis]